MRQGKYSAVKGMPDILPPDVHLWKELEAAACSVFGSYGFREIRPPVLEHTAVFARSIGETSDIVEKEMYTFEDKGGRSLTLRPEATAPIVRCYVEKNLHNLPPPQKFFYAGPMFRYERPQKGRLRQFHQIGAEAFGSAEPAMDAEVVSMLRRFLDTAGVGGLSFRINSIGCEKCRPSYRGALLDFLSTRLDALCPDCLRRYAQNPLRILDCKAAGCVEVRKDAPLVTGYLCEACRGHHEALMGLLSMLGVPFEEDPRLVRGLDYYSGTTFEVKSAMLGAQDAVAAGGRYDRLVEEFGGPPTPAIGFAVGMERLVSLAGGAGGNGPSPDVFIASLGEEAARKALRMAEGLRARGMWVELGYGGSLKSQMRRADRFGAGFALIVGDEELSKGRITWKDLRNGDSGEMADEEMYEFFKSPPKAAR